MLVTNGVGARGSWIYSEVARIADEYRLKVDYAKHKDSPVLPWARRLLDNARSLANVPAPDPEEACERTPIRLGVRLLSPQSRATPQHL
jgi:hypothetical protein